MPIVEFNDVSKIYKVGDMEYKALSNASFELNEGELVEELKITLLLDVSNGTQEASKIVRSVNNDVFIIFITK